MQSKLFTSKYQILSFPLIRNQIFKKNPLDMFINIGQYFVDGRFEKNFFCHKMINSSLREFKFSGNMYFSYTERLASAKVEKVTVLIKIIMI